MTNGGAVLNGVNNACGLGRLEGFLGSLEMTNGGVIKSGMKNACGLGRLEGFLGSLGQALSRTKIGLSAF